MKTTANDRRLIINIIHSVALISFTVWLFGMLIYGQFPGIHFFLGFTVITVLLLLPSKKKVTSVPVATDRKK